MEYRAYYFSREWVRAGHKVRILAGGYSLVPPVGRFLSKHASWLYFPVARFFPFLVGQVVYVIRKYTEKG
jgi:hypothetical protein